MRCTCTKIVAYLTLPSVKSLRTEHVEGVGEDEEVCFERVKKCVQQMCKCVQFFLKVTMSLAICLPILGNPIFGANVDEEIR